MAEAAVKTLTSEEQKKIKVLPFIDRMDLAFGASDIAVCRAGASTLAELALAGLPAILVPYPFAAADHQTENARAVAEQGAAIFCADHEIIAKLGELLTGLLNDDASRAELSRNMRSLARPDAAARIAEAVLGYAGYGHV
jgi:UDP-N-acetylglucosamine--N-acetylmuramyl-(pentapeptide) pyrophosphoryl-undecaprenol N-acetylglucosamine transferase